jgi:hypothetical protein
LLSANINLTDSGVLCEYVPLEQFKGLLQQRIAIAPDLLAVLIRDGAVVHTDHGTHLALGAFGKGSKKRLADLTRCSC